MVKNCFYCKCEINENSVVDICKICMFQVWGEKMSDAIISSMKKEKEKGNLDIGNVSGFFKENRENESLSEEEI